METAVTDFARDTLAKWVFNTRLVVLVDILVEMHTKNRPVGLRAEFRPSQDHEKHMQTMKISKE